MAEANQRWRMPPEWEPHAGTWASWPHNNETWPINLRKAQHEFLELVNAIAKHEHVYISCDTRGSDDFCRFLEGSDLAHPGNVILVDVPTNDAWARDYAPTFVVRRESAEQPSPVPPWFPEKNHLLGAVNWQYNAWGGKYPPFDLDQAAASKIAAETGAQLIDSQLCLEGGALEVNDQGVLLTTRSCALNSNRNPGWTQDAVETELTEKLGLSHVIWLPGNAIAADDTDGHIDQMARFVNNQTIVHAWTDDADDPHRHALRENIDELKLSLDRLGLDFELIQLPLPAKPVCFGEQRLPASYCNFYITNGSVIVPQFGDKQDDVALTILGEHFPKREIVGLPSIHLSVGLGSFHCLTQQMPVVDKNDQCPMTNVQ